MKGLKIFIAACIVSSSCIYHVVGSNKNQHRLIASMDRYPGYTGNLNVTGNVVVNFNRQLNSTVNQTFPFRVYFDLKGLDPACSAGCGIHIHTGTTCSNASLVGGHYWTPANMTNPWSQTFYNASVNGTARGNFPVVNGFNHSSNLGHSLVVHTVGGSRVACGTLLGTTGTLVAEIGQYPGSTSPYFLNGTVSVTFLTDDSMRFSYNLKGTYHASTCIILYTKTNGSLHSQALVFLFSSK